MRWSSARPAPSKSVPPSVIASSRQTREAKIVPRRRARREIREIRSAIPTRVELAKFREIRTRGRVALRFRGASSRSRARDVNFALKSAGRRKTAVRRSKWSACGEWQLAWASVLPRFGGDFIESRAVRGDFEDFGRFWGQVTLAPWLLGALEVLNFAKVAPQFQLLRRKKRKQFPLLGTKLSSRPSDAWAVSAD